MLTTSTRLGSLFVLLLCCDAILSVRTAQATPTAATSAAPIVEPVLLQMVRDAAVQRELKLTSAQVDQVREATSKVDGDWFRSRNLPTEKQLPVI
ncbi:MAG: thioredoxin, partial [Rubripirellula sp.]